VVNLVLTASSHGFIAAVITIPPGGRDRLIKTFPIREIGSIGCRAAPVGVDLGLIGGFRGAELSRERRGNDRSILS
jgi:hypothetical protein